MNSYCFSYNVVTEECHGLLYCYAFFFALPYSSSKVGK